MSYVDSIPADSKARIVDFIREHWSWEELTNEYLARCDQHAVRCLLEDAEEVNAYAD